MDFLLRTRPRGRFMSVLLALALALTSMSGVRAATGTIQETPRYIDHEIGIRNASFGLAGACALDEWTTAGNVAPMALSGRRDCGALLTADNTWSSRPAAATARLEQSFVVSGTAPIVRIFTKLSTDNPNTIFAAQAITLYDASNRVIAQAGLNQQGYYFFERSLMAYAGQTVRLSMVVAVDPTRAGSPSYTAMEVDFRMLHSGLVNPGFGQAGGCSLDGWATSGVAKRGWTPNGKCYAVISAGSVEGVPPQPRSAGLAQTFIVDPAFPRLRLFLQPHSNKPNTSFPAQTITVRDVSGAVIYQKSNNLQNKSTCDNYILDLGLTAYAGQAVLLNIDVLIDPSQATSPTDVRLNIDNQYICDAEGPDAPPGGSW